MQLPNAIFPNESRTFPGKRWLNVLCRSIHLCTAAVYTGGIFFEINPLVLISWLIATGISGGCMMAADLYSNGKWMLQNRGFLILLKIVVLGIFNHWVGMTAGVVLLITFISGISSHAPAKFRYYSVFHRKEI